MTLDPELAALMTQSVTVNRWTADSAYGVPLYAPTATVYPCRIVRKHQLVLDQQGRQVVSRTVVYIGPSSTTGGTPNLTERDKITLSDGSQADLLSVQKHIDADGTDHHEVAYCG